MNDEFISVTRLNEYVKSYLDQNKILHNIRVRGEVLNIKTYPTSQYFLIKDEDDARISVVMFFRGLNLKEKLKDGDDIIVTGQVTLYPKGGTYQLIAKEIEYYGEGAKLLALKKLKEKLAATGIFDEAKKKRIPRFATRIGVISGKDSAAWADIKQNIARRYPLSELFYFPCLVQGNDAPKSIINAFKKSEQYKLDVLIIARGGGSSDDLWAFNDETLIVELSKRTVPLISAVGHEIDTTLVDYVSDLRVSTPTAAAEHATENQIDLLQDLTNYAERLNNLIKNRLDKQSEKLSSLASRPVLISPINIINPYLNKVSDLKLRISNQFARTYNKYHQTLVILDERLNNHQANLISKKLEKIANLSAGLKSLSPLNVLERGYAFITDTNNQIIKNVDDIGLGDDIIAHLHHHQLVATVKEKKENE